MNGLVYLLNQAGEALAQANAELARLAAENEQLRALIPPEGTCRDLDSPE